MSEAYVICREFGGELAACVGIDAGAATDGAPCEKSFWVYYGADDQIAFARDFAFALFGSFAEDGIGRGQLGVRHDRQRRSIVGFVKPRHACDFHLGSEALRNG